MIMGDPAYPILPWLLKGYTKSSRLSPEEESFKAYLSSGRVCVEIAFGRLKARWRCLLKRLDIHFTFVAKIVTVCCILSKQRRKHFNIPGCKQLKKQTCIYISHLILKTENAQILTARLVEM